MLDFFFRPSLDGLDRPRIVVEYAAACPAECTIWGPGLSRNAVSNDETTWLRLQSRDCFGNNRTESDEDPFQLGGSLVRSPENEQYNYPMAMLVDFFEGAVSYESGLAQTGGVYVINYRTTKAGEYEVRATLNLEDGIVGDDDSESARLDCLQTDQANEEGAAGQALR